MALTLDIPVRTSITLPDNWQDCQTPQQLSYWLIARFDELAKTHDIDELNNLVEELRDYVDSQIDKVDRQVTLNHQNNILNAQKIEVIEDVDQTQNQKIESLEDSDVTQNQKISDIEGVNRTQTQRIQSNTEELNVLNRGLNGLRATVETQAEKFAGLTEAVTFNVVHDPSKVAQVDIIDKDVHVYNIVCDASLEGFVLNFGFNELPPAGSEFKFFITSPNKEATAGDIIAQLSLNGEFIEGGMILCGGYASFIFPTVYSIVESMVNGTPAEGLLSSKWLGGDILTVVFLYENGLPKLRFHGDVFSPYDIL